MTNVFFKRLCSRSNLFAAWRHVRSRALRSDSREIRNAAEDFDFHAFRNIQSIQSRLAAENFIFPPADGILKDKRKRESQGKLPRPLVLADIRSRIVQRALLQCLQPEADDELSARIGRIAEINNSTVNFGCTPSGGVPRALHRIVSLVNSDRNIFYKSDIGAFFTRVPHEHVLRFVFEQVGDSQFIEAFRNGLNVQLRNAAELGEYLSLFPDNEFGVAQGSSLSAFAGNVFLNEIDSKYRDTNGTALVRYVDDVILLGASNEDLQRTKSNFTKDLRRLGLSLYDPGAAPDKASEGHVRAGIEYLGCLVRQNHIEPSKKARASLLAKVDKKIYEAKETIGRFRANPNSVRNNEPTFAMTVTEIDRTTRGWANSFRFINNRLIFNQIDREIFKKVVEFRHWLNQQNFADDNVSGRVLGVYQTKDVEHKPLEEFLLPRGKKAPLPLVVPSRQRPKILPKPTLTLKAS